LIVRGAAGVKINEGATTLIDAGTVTGVVTIAATATSSISTSAGALNLDGFTGISLKVAATESLAIAATTVTVKGGVTLTTTGTGKIDLPTGGNLLIGTVATSGTNFTAANFNKMWDGSVVASTLHSHTASPASQVEVSGLTTTGLADGDAGYISANSTLTKAIATAMSTSRVFGSNEGTAGTMTVAGVIDNQNVDAGITILAGEALYLSKALAGAVTNVAPIAVGEVVAELGIAQAGNGGAGADVKMLLQIKAPIQL
jgi:hypothetical protein